MATAERRRLDLLPVVAIVVAVVAASWWQWSPADGDTPPAAAAAAEVAALAVEADSIYRFTALDQMVRASDAVVVGVVEATTRGRLVGDPAGGGVVSRVVTVRVEQTIWSPAGPLAESVLVEEEGWLPDGTPIEVNGVPASAVGDRGLWFLDQVAADDVSTMVIVNSQGRFLDTSAGTVGGDQRDALVQRLQDRPFDQLVELSVTVTREA